MVPSGFRAGSLAAADAADAGADLDGLASEADGPAVEHAASQMATATAKVRRKRLAA